MGAGFTVLKPTLDSNQSVLLSGSLQVRVRNDDNSTNFGFVAAIEDDLSATSPAGATANLSVLSGDTWAENISVVNPGSLPTSPPGSNNRMAFVAALLDPINGTIGPFDSIPFRAFRPGSFEVITLAGLQTLKRGDDDPRVPLPAVVKISAAPKRGRGKKSEAKTPDVAPAPEPAAEPAQAPKRGTPSRAKPKPEKRNATVPKRGAKPARKAEPAAAPKKGAKGKPAKKGGSKPTPAPKRGKKTASEPERTKPTKKAAPPKKAAAPKKPKAVLRFCSLPQLADCWISAPGGERRAGTTPSYWILRRMDPATWELELRRGEKRVVQYLARMDATPGVTLPNLFRLASSEDNSWPESIHLTPAL